MTITAHEEADKLKAGIKPAQPNVQGPGMKPGPAVLGDAHATTGVESG